MHDHTIKLIQLTPGHTVSMGCHPIVARWAWRTYVDPYHRSQYELKAVSHPSGGCVARLVLKPKQSLWTRILTTTGVK